MRPCQGRLSCRKLSSTKITPSALENSSGYAPDQDIMDCSQPKPTVRLLSGNDEARARVTAAAPPHKTLAATQPLAGRAHMGLNRQR